MVKRVFFNSIIQGVLSKKVEILASIRISVLSVDPQLCPITVLAGFPVLLFCL